MLHKILVIAAAVATCATARPPAPLPVASSPTCKHPVARNANFDDLTPGPNGVLEPLPTPYNGLDFQGFQYIELANPRGTPGVVPHSGDGYAFSNAATTTTGGSPEWTVQYAGSKVHSFNLQSFYYGCILNGGTATAAPVACNIAVTGYATGDDTTSTVQVASQEFSYNPSSATAPQQMPLGVFNENFKNLQYVLIQYTLPGGAAAAQTALGLAVDNVKYTTCRK